LIADFRTSPILASGSRAPVFSAIHFFSFRDNFQQKLLVRGKTACLLQVLFIGAVTQRLARLRVEFLPFQRPISRLKT